MNAFRDPNRAILRQQDILASAAILLRTDQPDRFDYTELASHCGVARQQVLAAFPFPELLAVGVLIGGKRPDFSGWEPDPELLARFTAHSVVRQYQRMLECSPPVQIDITPDTRTSKECPDA